MLAQLGYDQAQGYYLGKPMELEQLRALMEGSTALNFV